MQSRILAIASTAFLVFAPACEQETDDDTTPAGDDDDVTADDDVADDDSAAAVDMDGDGHSPPDDCDDQDPNVYPGAEPLCDGVADNDCDGQTDANELDLDGDGLSECDGDCDDGGQPPHASWPGLQGLTVAAADASLLGEPRGGLTGSQLEAPGDLNGDGISDLAIGDRTFDAEFDNMGKLYLLLGRTSGWIVDEDLGTHPHFVGDTYNRNLGGTDWVGDTNGDGIDDIVIDPWTASPDGYDHDYLVLGRSTGWTTGMSVDTVDAFTTDTLSPAGDSMPCSSYLGDVDGDGLNDWLMGDMWNLDQAGQAFVVSGAQATGAVDLPDDASAWLWGDADQMLQASPLGDINGDGIDDIKTQRQVVDYWDTVDIILGGPDLPHDAMPGDVADHTYTMNPYCGLSGVYLVGDVNADGADDLAVNVVTDHGEECGGIHLFWGGPGLPRYLDGTTADVHVTRGRNAEAVGWAGDLDGDGIDDLVFRGIPEGGEEITDVYMVFGHDGAWPEFLDTEDADVHIAPSEPLTWIAPHDVGARPASRPGHKYRGDLDGDGIDELFLHNWGSDEHAPNGVMGGGVVAVFAGRTCWPAELVTEDADASLAGVFEGQTLGQSERFVVEDIDGDGMDDMIMASDEYPLGSETGEVFVFFGRERTF